MKKVLFLLFASALLILLAACQTGTGEAQPGGGPLQPVEDDSTPPVSEAPSDFNWQELEDYTDNMHDYLLLVAGGVDAFSEGISQRSTALGEEGVAALHQALALYDGTQPPAYLDQFHGEIAPINAELLDIINLVEAMLEDGSIDSLDMETAVLLLEEMEELLTILGDRFVLLAEAIAAAQTQGADAP